MLFVIAGVLIIAMNLAGIGWFATWNWDFTGDLWKFCVPFVAGGAVVGVGRQFGPEQAPRD